MLTGMCETNDIERAETESPKCVCGKRRVGRRIASLAFAVVLALIIAECVLRIGGYSYEWRASIVQGANPFDEAGRGDVCEMDRDYLWVPPRFAGRLEEVRAAKPDVLFLGDSCTELGRYDEEFSALLEQRRTERAYTIAKIGVTGWSSAQGLRLLDREAEKSRPRVAVFYYGWNDHWNSMGLTDREALDLYATPLYWLRYPRLGQLVLQAYAGARGMRVGGAPLRVPAKEFRENLIRLIETARRFGAVPVLLTAPAGHEAGGEPALLAPRWVTNLADLIPLHERYVEIVRAVAAEHGAALCDLAAGFRAVYRAGHGQMLFQNDGIHLTDAGDRMIAEMLYECFEELGLFNKLDRAER